MKRIAIGIMCSCGIFAASAQARECAVEQQITAAKVQAVQEQWAQGIVAIGKAGDASERALEHIDNLYAYGKTAVLFKPTQAAQKQFRSTRQGALSYFVGGDQAEDKGFALAPYTNVRFQNEALVLGCEYALAQGNYYFTRSDGSEIKVEYSFGYMQDEKGDLRINLHHSSLPYQ